MTPEQRIDRAQRIDRLLKSEDWNAAWNALRETYIHVIESSADDVAALDARRMLRAATMARQHLEALLSDGAIANADIAARRSRLKM